MPLFKRKSDRRSWAGDTPSLSNGKASANGSTTRNGRCNEEAGFSPDRSNRPQSLLLNSELIKELADSGVSNSQIESPMRTSSRLSKTLLEILHDKEALPSFISFMESQNAGQYVRFWLDAKSFQTAAWTRIRTHSLNALAKSSLTEVSLAGSTSSPSRSLSSSSSPAEVFTEAETTLAPATSNATSILSPSFLSSSAMTDKTPAGETNPTCRPLASDTCNRLHDNQCQVNPPSSLPSAFSSTPPLTTTTTATSLSSTSSSPSYSSPCAADSRLFPSADMVEEQGLPGSLTSDKDRTLINSSNKHTDSDKSSHLGASQLPDTQLSNSSVVNDASGATAKDNCQDVKLGQITKDDGKKEECTDNSSSDRQVNKLGTKLLSSIEKDAVSIYVKYISLDATHSIKINDALRNETTSKICQEVGKVDPECFVACQDYVLEVMKRDYYTDFLHSVYHCKHQIDVLTSGKVYLADILHNDTAIFYFMEFMEQEGAVPLFQFWMAAENFQQHLSLAMGCYDGLQAQEDAMVLYDKYFSLQATEPLGFDDTIRLEVESNICREGGPLPDCFAKPKNLVLRVIEKIHFPSFLQGDLYYKYLSELINTVQLAHDLPQKVRRRLGSDASSEHSIGSQSTGTESISSRNTLLAADTSHFKKAFNKIDVDMRIDTILLNPDALWKRNNTGKMSFGRINNLGQFVSEYDPEPEHDKKKGSMFFRKRKDREKEQEDMAVQIAEMIIKDVTAITQGSSVPSNPCSAPEQTT
ncbi:A-kinase anchor protein 10, mitochondrial isoform X2 [Octopus bimaculoides]|uniref:A-kinase anchor protein 10, mitochondrial isoform X2 n=1 Tax=Octopus bimaculoides TaxID=37653 RepID=UPI00071DE007|nr:A-kinase anchor protein 10, mitochondrial isoform X2 [Octopus bimaculoides]|eukprot:XP_014770827.1 PREDICTED: A-kinase anchor protein 10, mitochondrial-like isoform X3 [Octopus bimaculoides]